jgi:hypothetical protein
MDHVTWSRFSCLLGAPAGSTLEAIRHWQYVHAERRRVDSLISTINQDLIFDDDFETFLTEDQEARLAELYRHLDDVYRTYEQGDHTKFVSTDTPQPPVFVHLPVPIHLKIAFKEWRQQCWILSEQPELIRILPSPPVILCTRPGCNNTLAPLETCMHSLTILYRNAELGRTELLKERNFWHPDRWSRVPQPYRQEVEKMAIIIFQVLQPLCDQVK